MPQSISQNMELEVVVAAPEDKYDLLTTTEAVLRSAVEVQRLRGTDPQNLRGILVTRHNANRYTLRLDKTVPYGETWEESL